MAKVKIGASFLVVERGRLGFFITGFPFLSSSFLLSFLKGFNALMTTFVKIVIYLLSPFDDWYIL